MASDAPRPLSDRTALVTGGSQGIGRAICETLARDGCNVIVHVKTESDASVALVAALGRAGGEHRLVIADFADPDAISAMFAQVAQWTDTLDILINNAGFETAYAAETMTSDAWNAVLQVNLNAPAQCCRQAFPMMKASRDGVIVNISSIHDEVGRKGLSHYCTAKAGLKMLGRCLALEWAEFGIRVVTVSPGAITTEMNRAAIEEFGRERFDHWIPAGRIGEVTDVSETVAFLCSQKARYVTGTEIYIDGGYMRNLVRYDDRPPNGT